MTVVHAIAQKGFGAGTNELYDRYISSLVPSSLKTYSRSVRPSYQPTALDHIRRALRSPGPYNVVE